MKTNRQIVLASASPRRKELLQNIGLEFQVQSSDFHELESHENPSQLAVFNAQGKARQVASKHENAIVIGVDTIGAYQNHILGKPKNRQDALRILNLLNNTTHQVISAITLIDTQNHQTLTETVITEVTIDQLAPQQIEQYIDSGEGEDKAASYAIQGLGSLFVKEIKGDYFNVVGLPIHTLYQMLQKMDCEILL